jgi:hypothetical protein
MIQPMTTLAPLIAIIEDEDHLHLQQRGNNPMTIPKLAPHALNMISAWISALATLTVLIVLRPPIWLHHVAVPTALAVLAIAIVITITRLKPGPDATLALSGGLGAAFSALSFCLIQ